MVERLGISHGKMGPRKNGPYVKFDAFSQAEAERDELRIALKKIASCEKRASGDVVDIARHALLGIKECERCEGSGAITVRRFVGRRIQPEDRRCPACDGSGSGQAA